MSSKSTVVLFIRCPDQKGLVARVAGFLFRHNANIIDSDHHTDTESGLFLMRVEFDLVGLSLKRSEIKDAFSPLAKSLKMEWDLHFVDRPLRMALFVSKYSHCLYDILFRAQEGELRGEIPLIISNHKDLESIGMRFGIPFHVIPITSQNRIEQERKHLALLKKNRIDVIVLARYMQILGNDFVSRYPNRIINIHHSFLPAFEGSKPYHQAFERGVKLIGATSHYVTAQLDQGPIIEQDVARISHRDSVDDLVRKGRDLERLVLARAVRLHLENRVLTYGRKTVVFD